MGFNDDLIADYRANGTATSGPFVGRQLLLLTTTGAKSGTARTVPLVYTTDGDDYIVVASKGGAPTSPNWFHNLKADRTVSVQVGKEKFQATATAVSPESERQRLYEMHAKLNPGFRDYLKKTTRRIPVVRLTRIRPASG